MVRVCVLLTIPTSYRQHELRCDVPSNCYVGVVNIINASSTFWAQPAPCQTVLAQMDRVLNASLYNATPRTYEDYVILPTDVRSINMLRASKDPCTVKLPSTHMQPIDAKSRHLSTTVSTARTPVERGLVKQLTSARKAVHALLIPSVSNYIQTCHQIHDCVHHSNPSSRPTSLRTPSELTYTSVFTTSTIVPHCCDNGYWCNDALEQAAARASNIQRHIARLQYSRSCMKLASGMAINCRP